MTVVTVYTIADGEEVEAHNVCALRARKPLPPLIALLTLDLATPLELAVTRHRAHFNVGHVSPVAAHQIAAVRRHRRNIALTSLRAQTARPVVRVAKVRRRVRVDQILARWRLDRLSLGDEVDAVVTCDHFGRAVVAILKSLAHLSERGHDQPAGLHRT